MEDRLEVGFSISDVEDSPAKLELSAVSSNLERVTGITIDCEQGSCLLTAEVDRKRPSNVKVELTLKDSRGGVASSSFSVKIEPDYLAEASLGALQTALETAEAGAFLVLSPNLFSEPASWSIKEELFLTKEVNLIGPGSDLLTLDAGGQSRHLRIAKGLKLSIEGFDFTNGQAQDDGGQGDFEALGGAIFNEGVLELKDITITSSQAVKGGAIYNFGQAAQVIIRDSLFGGKSEATANRASRSGGALFNDGGRLELYGSQVNFNLADERGGGAYNLGETATMLIDSSEFLSNVSLDGGAVKNEKGSLRVQNGSLLKDNTATEVEGGAIFNTDSKVEIVDSSIIGNVALKGAGGGIYSFGENANVLIENSHFQENSAISGGGLYHEVGSGPLTIKASIIEANRAENFGGGVFSGGPSSLSADSSIRANVADSNGDDIGYGGGFFYIGEDSSGISLSVISNNQPDDFAQPIPDAALFQLLGLDPEKLPGNR